MMIAEQIKLKIKLEGIVAKDVKSIFNSMLLDFTVSVANTGRGVDAIRYDPAWVAMLDKHYRRVQKAFIGIGLKSYKEEDDFDEELLLLALLAWRTEAALKQAGHITNTNTRNMLDALSKARSNALMDGVTLTNRELAKEAAVVLRRKLKSRVSIISMTETETPAETTKFIEAETASGLKPSVLGGGAATTTTRKVWRNAGDKRVRTGIFNHVRPNGQTVNLLEPFIVSGERLMFPKDTSLGASPGNVTGCRCLGIYIL